MPNVPVFDLAQNYNGMIFAGTHGRGAYQLLPVTNAPFSPGAFQISGTMSVSHDSATTLPNGKVLIVGGTDPTTFGAYNTAVTVRSFGLRLHGGCRSPCNLRCPRRDARRRNRYPAGQWPSVACGWAYRKHLDLYRYRTSKLPTL